MKFLHSLNPFSWTQSVLLILSVVLTFLSIILFLQFNTLVGFVVSLLLLLFAFIFSVSCWWKEKLNPVDMSVLLIIIIAFLFIILSWASNRLNIPLIEYSMKNIYLDKWDWIALIVAVLSLAFAGSTWYSQNLTEKNTMRITPESQKQLLMDYVRHFYCNLIIIYALEARLAKRYDRYYPSEEHLLKLRVNIDSLHPAAFFNHSEKYHAIHELQFKIQNFNMELEVITKHFTDVNLHYAAKERDFATLRFKMGYLSGEVAKTIEKLFGGTQIEIANRLYQIIDTCARERNQKNGKDIPLMDEAKEKFDRGELSYFYNLSERDEFIATLFPDRNQEKIDRFVHRLNQNIYVEVYGYNASNGRKIFLIPFDKNEKDF